MKTVLFTNARNEKKYCRMDVLKEKNFNVIYLVDGCGGWGFCEHNFWEVWLKST